MALKAPGTVGFSIHTDDLGRWVYASGTRFPVFDINPPRGSRFYRSDLDTWYSWDGDSWEVDAAGGSTIVVEEADGSPSAVIDTLKFDSADGLVVTDLGGGEAQVDLSGIPQSLVTDLVSDLAGKASTSHQATHQHGGSDFLVAKVLSPAQLTASQNDYAPGDGDIWRLTSDASRDITGIGSPASGRRLLVTNVGSFTIRLMHQNVGSAEANRLICSGGANISLAATGQQALLWYDATDSRWRASLL